MRKFLVVLVASIGFALPFLVPGSVEPGASTSPEATATPAARDVPAAVPPPPVSATAAPPHRSATPNSPLGAAAAAAETLPSGARASTTRPTTGPLTEPSARAPRDIALDYLRSIAADDGLSPDDLAEMTPRDEVHTAHNGMTNVFVQQRVHGLDVVGALANVTIDRDGRVVHATEEFARSASLAIEPSAPRLSEEEAIESAGEGLGLVASQPAELVETLGGPAREAIYEQPELSADEIPVQLAYYPADDALRLVWDVVLRTPDGQGWWHLWVSADDGALLDRASWMDEAGYEVFALGTGDPDHGARTVVQDAADPVASPGGWHDLVFFQVPFSFGNNVTTRFDPDGIANGDEIVADGGVAQQFTFPLDLADEPADYVLASVSNLFYWTNVLHDLLYQFGFDEAAGNFQAFNRGGGGIANDALLANAQDPTRPANASFGTPPDGWEPQMRMGVVHSLHGLLSIASPPGVAGDYPTAGAVQAPPLDDAGVSGPLVRANDGVGATTNGCEPLIGPQYANAVVLGDFDPATCDISQQVQNAQNAGALAFVLVAGIPAGLRSFSLSQSVAIPTVAVDFNTITNVLAALPLAGAVLRRDPNAEASRDTALDAGIIAHEYAHGLSNRLVGGPSNVDCLDNAEQMGEGWSDFLGLYVTVSPTQLPADPIGVGAYAFFRAPDGGSIRSFPYSTDLTLNPQTYSSVRLAAGSGGVSPHRVGEVWTALLWEVYWNLVEAHGFDPDLYTGTGGNNLALQLVVDGMKIQSCSPTFVDARDAILAADLVNSGGTNQCLLWEAFAKRGLGSDAQAGSASSVADAVDGFALPPECTGRAIDTDQDGVSDDEDNCLDLANPAQLDSNQDGYGNACDADFNDDGIVGIPDLGELVTAFGSGVGDAAYREVIDVDGDGSIGFPDFSSFVELYQAAPGPSGLACAGVVPCVMP